mgnify:CR=1 FL=1
MLFRSKWTGTGWQTMPTTGIGSTRLIRWGVVSANEIYAYADSGSTDRAFYKFNGTSWTEVGRSRFAQQGGRPWADPRGGAAYLLSPFGRIEKITPTGYQVIAYTPSIRDLSMPTQTSAFAVGGNLFLARWDGAKLAGLSPHFGPLQLDTRWVRALRFNPDREPLAAELPLFNTEAQQFFER